MHVDGSADISGRFERHRYGYPIVAPSFDLATERVHVLAIHGQLQVLVYTLVSGKKW